MDRQTIVAVISSALVSIAATYGIGVRPADMKAEAATAEATEYAANSQLIRDELTSCLARLETCWRECN